MRLSKKQIHTLQTDEVKVKVRKTKKKPRKTKIKIQKGPSVSEHCVVRYVERIKDQNVEHIREDILHPEVVALVDFLGPNGTYPHPEGYSIVFQNNVAVTVFK